jgi:hypothetical protein
VREAIELLLQARTVTKAWIVDQLVELARTKATDLYEWDTGLRLKDSDEIDPENIGAVAEIEETRITDKKNNDVVTIKIKQHSRHQALKGLGQNLQDGGRASGNQPDDGPVEVTDHRALIMERLE